MDIGYIRVSTTDQNIDRQLESFKGLDIQEDNIFVDKLSGKDRNRPALESMIRFARKGDVVHVKSFDRLGRSMIDVLQIVRDINAKQASVHIIDGDYTYCGDDTPMMVLLMGITASVAEFERAMILERSREGIAIAKLIPGKYVGRKPALQKIDELKMLERMKSGENVTHLAREYGLSRNALYKIRDRVTGVSPATEL